MKAIDLKKAGRKLNFPARGFLFIVILLMAFLAFLCAAMASTRGREAKIKVTYDGPSYQGKGNIYGTYDNGYDGYSAKYDTTAAGTAAYNSLDLESSAAMAPEYEADMAYDDNGSYDGGLFEGPSQGSAQERKLTYSYDYELETTEFDGLISQVESFLNKNGGWMESSSVSSMDFDRYDLSGTDTVRRGHYGLKVPAGQCDALKQLLADGEAQFIYEDKRMSDKTQAYADLELQKQSYLVEYGKLEDLLAQADQVADLISIQDRLSYLNYQIQSMDKQMELIDEDVAYSDVSLIVSEVIYYTATVQEYRFRFGERMAESFESFVYTIPDFLFAMVYVTIGGFVVIGLFSILFRVLFNIRNKKARDQVVRLVDGRDDGSDKQV